MSEPTIEESLLLSRTEERDLARQEVNACHHALRLEREETERLREALRRRGTEGIDGIWHVWQCPALSSYTRCTEACKYARAALEVSDE